MGRKGAGDSGDRELVTRSSGSIPPFSGIRIIRALLSTIFWISRISNIATVDRSTLRANGSNPCCSGPSSWHRICNASSVGTSTTDVTVRIARPKKEIASLSCADGSANRLKQRGVRLLSTQNPAEQLHGGAGVYTPVQTCNTHIAPQAIHRPWA
jgi:hypothetical protein